MTYDERLKFYLGEDLINSNININDYPDKITLKKNHGSCLENIYGIPFRKLMKETKNEDKYFKCVWGDVDYKNDEKIDFLTLCKNRNKNRNYSVILRCLNFDRHWGNYYRKPKDPIPKFKNKIPKLFWRGVSTGSIDRIGNRFNLIETWYKKDPKIDIGFSFLHRDYLKPKYQKYVLGQTSISHFLKHKYILSVEGNDKDSGINWKLNSSSLVLMPKPTCTSWLMETTLVPDYHYVLIKDDFSDLKEKIEWCEKNQDECINIIKNANEFMSQFEDNNKEKILEKDVLNTYFKLIKS